MRRRTCAGRAGRLAVVPLIGLPNDNREWARVNAAFSLGEMDSNAADAVPELLRCLSGDSDREVRTAVDALDNIGRAAQAAALTIARLLRDQRPQCNESTCKRLWPPGEMVRANADMAMSRLCIYGDHAEFDLIDARDDLCGHMGVYAMQRLRRIASPRARRAVLNYLSANRWNASINGQRQY